MSVLDMRNLHVCYGKKQVLHHLNLQVGNGEILSLLGTSGCGKSTLIKTISGLLPVCGGTIYMDGADVTAAPPQGRKAAVVFQELRLFPHMDVADNITFYAKLKGVHRKERLKEAGHLLALVHLPGIEEREVGTLSGGQKQRVALARALAAKPQYLLLDEPFANLDTRLRLQMQNLLLELHAQNPITTIVVTHDIGEATVLASRVALMLEGSIPFVGTPAELTSNKAPAIVQDFVSDWKANIRTQVAKLEIGPF